MSLMVRLLTSFIAVISLVLWHVCGLNSPVELLGSCKNQDIQLLEVLARVHYGKLSSSWSLGLALGLIKIFILNICRFWVQWTRNCRKKDSR